MSPITFAVEPALPTSSATPNHLWIRFHTVAEPKEEGTYFKELILDYSESSIPVSAIKKFMMETTFIPAQYLLVCRQFKPLGDDERIRIAGPVVQVYMSEVIRDAYAKICAENNAACESHT